MSLIYNDNMQIIIITIADGLSVGLLIQSCSLKGEKMDSKILIGAAVIVIVAIAGVGAFFLMNGNHGGSDPDPFVTNSDTNRLLVYGNADNNNYLDKDDIKFINDIVKNGEWDKKKYPFADANQDGKVTSADADTVQNFLDGKKGTMYYMDWNLEVSSVPYPLTGKFAVAYDSSLWIGQIVGFYEDVTYMSRPQGFVDGLREDMFPGAAERIEAQGGTQRYEFDLERLIAANISVCLGDTNALTDNFISKVKSYPSITPILLPENREHNGLNWSNSVITLGVMMNKQDNTKEYIKYIEEVSGKIESAVKEATKSQETKTYLLVYCDPYEPGWYVDIRGTDPELYGDVVTCEKLPLKSAMAPQGDGYIQTSVENILALDPDVIIFSTWGPFMENYTIDEYKALVHEKLDYLKESTAYKTNQCYSISYEVYGTLPGIAGLIYLGSQIWPDLFDEKQGLEYIQEYFDKFTKISGTDVKTVTGLLPLVQKDIE